MPMQGFGLSVHVATTRNERAPMAEPSVGWLTSTVGATSRITWTVELRDIPLASLAVAVRMMFPCAVPVRSREPVQRPDDTFVSSTCRPFPETTTDVSVPPPVALALTSRDTTLFT